MLALKVVAIDGKGRGVVAERDFAPGDLIECCPLIVLNGPDQVLAIGDTPLSEYVFHWREDDVVVALGYGSLYNHSYTPNARYVHDEPNGVLNFVAIAPIAAGQEVTINYNGSPDNKDPVWFTPL